MDLVALNKELKDRRNFDVCIYLNKKQKALGKFFKNNALDAVVVPISGGIDSAVVLGIMFELQKKQIIKKVLPLFIPIRQGTTGQDEARIKAKEIITMYGYDFNEIDLTQSTIDIINRSIKPKHLSGNDEEWAWGQLASIMRTPVIYYHAALLQTEGYRSIVVGTTNRDEGSYIGFYGKASDGMNDLQPIADIHKSEVFKIAHHFGIPQSILYATPKGDVWDGRNDEQMIGAPYWFLELYLLWKEYYTFTDFLDYNNTTPRTNEQHEQVIKWVENIEKLNKTNLHKYQVGMPGHFVDVMERKIPGGWQ